jgi:hypothetical protein
MTAFHNYTARSVATVQPDISNTHNMKNLYACKASSSVKTRSTFFSFYQQHVILSMDGTQLKAAVQRGDYYLICDHKDSIIHSNFHDSYKRNPLHWASDFDHSNLISIFIEWGFNVNEKGEYNEIISS